MLTPIPIMEITDSTNQGFTESRLMSAHQRTIAPTLALLLFAASSAAAQTIHEAVDRDDTALAARLLKKDRRLIHATGEMEYTPLHRAVIRSSEGMVRLLLRYAPDVNARDFVGLSPLHYASTTGSPSF